MKSDEHELELGSRRVLAILMIFAPSSVLAAPLHYLLALYQCRNRSPPPAPCINNNILSDREDLAVLSLVGGYQTPAYRSPTVMGALVGTGV